jgi:hypothetical protein
MFKLKNTLTVTLLAAHGHANAYNLFESRTTTQIRNKWEEIFSQKKLSDEP